MKLDPAIAARVQLGERGIPCPGCNWPLKVWASSAHYQVLVVTCWTSECPVHALATRERIDGGARSTFSVQRGGAQP